MTLSSPLCRVGRKKPIQLIIERKAPKDFKIYVEPFVGSGDIFFKLNLSPEIKSYINDKDTDIANAFKIMKSNPNVDNLDRFKNKSLEEVRRFVKQSHTTPLDKLATIIYKLCGTFGSKGGDNKIYKNPNIETKLRKIPNYAEYLKNTTITSSDWTSTLSHDSPNTFFYLDPPYEASKGLYKNPLIDYVKMAERLKRIKGKFLLSLNDSPEIRKVFKDFNVRGISVRGGSTDNSDLGAGTRKEVLISNY